MDSLSSTRPTTTTTTTTNNNNSKSSSSSDKKEKEDDVDRLQAIEKQIQILQLQRHHMPKTNTRKTFFVNRKEYFKWRENIRMLTEERGMLLEKKRVDEVVQAFKKEGIPFYDIEHDKIECLLCSEYIVDSSSLLVSPCCGKKICKSCFEKWGLQKMTTSRIYSMKVEHPTCPFCLTECPTAEEYENLIIARAEEGKAWAQLSLFYMFRPEKGKEEIARRWLQRAADQGNAEAQYRLGVEMREANGDVDTDESLALFRAAAVKGISKAQLGLAIGLRDKRDYAEAFRWYTFAAAQGRPVVDARINVSQIFSNGECGQNASEERALYWIKRAIEQEDDSTCCYMHSSPYEVGKVQVFLAMALIGLGKKLYGEDDTGIEPEAFYWVRQAVGNDLPEAIEMERQMIAHNSRYCYFCKKPASKDEKFQKCSRCKYPTYCGRECQIKHWQMGHKHTCYNPSSTDIARK